MPRATPPDAIDPSELRRVLVIKLRHHGDVLLSSPVLSVLAREAPQAQIDALVYADTAPMLALHPALSQLHVIDRGWKRLGPRRQLAAEWALLRQLRERRYDLLVHLTDHPRGAWLARWLRPRWSVAPDQPGRRWWARSFTHRHAVLPRLGRHTVERHLDALRRLGIHPQPDARRLSIEPGDDARASVDARLARTGLAAGAFVHLHPASRWLFKCWPVAANAALIDRLADAGWPVIVTAAPDPKEREMVERIVAACRGPVVSWAGELSLKEMAALTARARLFVGVDSAPMHIAAAVGTPAVALFGPSSPVDWGPWQVAHRVVTSDQHPCRPCGLDGCGGGKRSDCLDSLSVETVWRAAASLLAEPPAPAGPA